MIPTPWLTERHGYDPTYGGVSLFVVVFAVYPFAAEMFRQSQVGGQAVLGRQHVIATPWLTERHG
ncbi:hypothetical protein OUHCRE14_45980 [Enterobacter hormaechei subsp. hoffmannii]